MINEELKRKAPPQIETAKGADAQRENFKRHEAAIAGYLAAGFLENLPSEYQAEYQALFAEHAAHLAENPLNPECQLTLVLPAFKEEKFILSTLESLNQQTGINPHAFEVILVVNYPKSRKPEVNDYDSQGRKIGSHLDRTREIAVEFAKTANFTLHVLEQDFPANLAGVGIASKLGMDLAVLRQQVQPRVVGYYGADSLFSPQWIAAALAGYTEPQTDGVRGKQTQGILNPEVEDENGLQILTTDELQVIKRMEGRRYKYYQQFEKLRNLLEAHSGGKQQQKVGLATMTAGIYAEVGGMTTMNIGEDWQIATDVKKAGNIYYNQEMLATAVGRIEPPRAGKTSYTGALWEMYRAIKYHEGSLFNASGELMVKDPEALIYQFHFAELFQSLFALKNNLPERTRQKLLDFISLEELSILLHESEAAVTWESFLDSLRSEFSTKFKTRLTARFPDLPISTAEEKLNELIISRVQKRDI